MLEQPIADSKEYLLDRLMDAITTTAAIARQLEPYYTPPGDAPRYNAIELKAMLDMSCWSFEFTHEDDFTDED